jgi:hypothetical protein
MEGREFVLEATPVMAIEGGPVVCQLTLTYQGAAPRLLQGFLPQESAVRTLAPVTWGERIDLNQARMVSGMGWYEFRMKPKDQRREFIYLHQMFGRIPSGDARLTFTRGIAIIARDGQGEGLLDKDAFPVIEQRRECSAEMAVNVEPATAERLQQIGGQIRLLIDQPNSPLRMDEPNPPPQQSKHLANILIGTHQPRLTPVALRLLTVRRDRDYQRDAVLQQVYKWSRQDLPSHGELIQYLRRHGRQMDGRIFTCWREDKVKLADDEIDSLLQARDPWIRAFTCKLYPDKCDQGTRDALCKQDDDIRAYLEE